MKLFLLSALGFLGLITWLLDSPRRTSDWPEDPWQASVSKLKSNGLEDQRTAAESIGELALEFRSAKRDATQVHMVRKVIQELGDMIADRDRNSEVRRNLVFAVATLGALSHDVLDKLLLVLGDENEDQYVRGTIAMDLPDIATSDEVSSSIIAAATSPNEVVRVNATQALGRLGLGLEKLLPVLQRTIDDRSPQVRVAALTHAAGFAKNDRQAMVILLRGMNDAHPMVRQVAVSLLSQVAIREVTQELLILLKSPDVVLRVYSGAALLRISADDAAKGIRVLHDALQSKDVAARQAAAQALITSGHEAKPLIPTLEAALQDSDKEVRVLASGALASITGAPDAYLSTLVEGLAYKDEKARLWAASSLMMFAPKAQVAAQPKLINATRHEDAFVRGIALSILSGFRLEPTLAIDLFTRAIEDDDSHVRLVGLEALAAMGQEAKPALPKIREALEDEDDAVRNAARRALQKISIARNAEGKHEGAKDDK